MNQSVNVEIGDNPILDNKKEYALVITKDFAEKHPECMKIVNRLIECELTLDSQREYLDSFKNNK